MATIGSDLSVHIALKIIVGLQGHLILAVNVLMPLFLVPNWPAYRKKIISSRVGEKSGQLAYFPNLR